MLFPDDGRLSTRCSPSFYGQETFADFAGSSFAAVHDPSRTNVFGAE
jgi:hypothetical protein